MGVETMAIAAIAASAVATTASAISASSNNRRSIQTQKDLYEQQRLDQLSDYYERTGIEAQSKQLSNIGVNPASVFAGGSIPGGSMPSVPSVPSAPHLENVGAAATGSLSQMVSAVGNIQEYKERDARVSKLQQEYETEKFNTANTQLKNFLLEKYGDQQWAADLLDSQNRAYLHFAQGDLAAAESSYKDILTKIAGEDFKMKKEDALQYAQYLQLVRQHLTAQNDLLGEQQVTEKSKQAENYASAGAHRASASYTKALEKTENDLRPYRKQIERANGYVAQSTSPYKIRESEQEVLKSKWFNEILHNKNLSIVLENKDKALYNAFQRLVRGKSLDGDVTEFLRGLSELGSTQYIK